MFTELLKEDPPHLVKFGNSLSGMSTKRRDKLRVFLYIQQGMRCCFCLCKMRLVKIKEKQQQPQDLATFEHLVDEWKSDSGKNNDLSMIALSCYRCNNGRSRWRQSLAIKYYTNLFGDRKTFHEQTNRMSQREIAAKFGPPKIPDIKPRIRISGEILKQI